MTADLARFSWRMTAAAYMATALFLLIALTLSPGAINAALGVGTVAVLLTVLSIDTTRRGRRRESVRATLAAQVPGTDPLTICPVCHLMGPHSIEVVPGSSTVVRRCAFYPEQHAWGAER